MNRFDWCASGMEVSGLFKQGWRMACKWESSAQGMLHGVTQPFSDGEYQCLAIQDRLARGMQTDTQLQQARPTCVAWAEPPSEGGCLCARAEAPLLKDRDFLYREVLQPTCGKGFRTGSVRSHRGAPESPAAPPAPPEWLAPARAPPRA